MYIYICICVYIYTYKCADGGPMFMSLRFLPQFLDVGLLDLLIFSVPQVAAAFDHAHRALLCPWAIALPSSRGASKCPKNEFARPSRIWQVFERRGWIKVGTH